MAEIPKPVRAYIGLWARAVSEARDLPRRAAELPVLVASTTARATLRAGQQYADLVNRGDDVLSRLHSPSEEPPAWATFDEDDLPPEPGSAGQGSAGQARAGQARAGQAGAASVPAARLAADTLALDELPADETVSDALPADETVSDEVPADFPADAADDRAAGSPTKPGGRAAGESPTEPGPTPGATPGARSGPRPVDRTRAKKMSAPRGRKPSAFDVADDEP